MKDSTKVIIKNTIILCLLFCICFFILAGVHVITKDAIIKQEEKAKINVYKAVLANVSSIEKSNVNQNRLNKQLNNNDCK